MTFQVGVLTRRISILFVLQLCVLLGATPWSGADAQQKLVDPNKVAPEHRAAAEKRRAEQVKLIECSKKADEAKVSRRDRTSFINECLDN